MQTFERSHVSSASMMRLKKNDCFESNPDGQSKGAVGWRFYGDNNYRFNIRLPDASQLLLFEHVRTARSLALQSHEVSQTPSAGASRIPVIGEMGAESAQPKRNAHQFNPKIRHTSGPKTQESLAVNAPSKASNEQEHRRDHGVLQNPSDSSRSLPAMESVRCDSQTEHDSRSVYGEELQKKLFKKLKIITTPVKPFDICNLSQIRPGPDELVELCLNDSDGSKSTQTYFESLSAEDLMVVRLAFQRQLSSLMSTQSGTFALIFLLKKDKDFFEHCEALCLRQMKELQQTKCAIKLMQAIAEESVGFSKAILTAFREHDSNLKQTADQYLLLNKVIPQIQQESDLDFLLESIENTYTTPETVLKSHTLRIIPALLDRLTSKRADRLISSLLRFVDYLVDNKLGLYAVLSLLRKKHPKPSSTVRSVLLKRPVLMFTRKHRMTVLARMLASFDQYPKRFLDDLITRLMSCRDLLELKYIFHYEDSTCLLLNVLIKLENPALAVAFNNQYFKDLFENQAVVSGPIFRGFQRELSAITDLSNCCIQEADTHERYDELL